MEVSEPQTLDSLRTLLIIVLGTLVFIIPVIGTLIVIKLKADQRKSRKPADSSPSPPSGEPPDSPAA